MSLEKIKIRGARENNLKNVSLTLPRNQMIVMTGLSGSGKSSLAFDTIYAEGQRRYVESLSSYARMFLGQMDKPDVDLVEGLSPAISIDQKTRNHNPRSTVGTVTEINDYLRLLYAKAGHPYCPVCGAPIQAMAIDQMVDEILTMPDRTRFLVLAPAVRGKKGTHQKLIQNLQRQGFTRLIVDGEEREIDREAIDLDKNKKHDLYLVVDRLIIRENLSSRLTSSIETALKAGGGTMVILPVERDAPMDLSRGKIYSSQLACPNGHITLEELEPRLFSFNSPQGACPDCDGLGYHARVDDQLCIPNPDLSLDEGALAPYATAAKGTFYREMISAVAALYDWPTDQPIGQAPDELIHALLYGTERKVRFPFHSHFSGDKTFSDYWEGAIANLTHRYEQGGDATKARIRPYLAANPCESCHGARLRPEALAVRIGEKTGHGTATPADSTVPGAQATDPSLSAGPSAIRSASAPAGGKNIAELSALSIQDALAWVQTLTFPPAEAVIADPILKEVKARLSFLLDVGLGYLTLDRYAATLSGGESQRIRLATQIGSGLVGVIYVLDEPSIGLHQRDNAKLLQALRNLTEMGNTLLVVEHDEETMREADWIVDVGPGAGSLGGEIVAQGPLEKIIETPGSITGDYLAHRKFIAVPESRRIPKHFLKVKGCRENNLKNVDISVPLGVFTCVTGVSGSGKSSFVEEILYKALANRLNGAHFRPGRYKGLEGTDPLDKVIEIDQSPIGRTPRSNPATYTKVFDDIREVFALSNDAKMRGYDKGRFSFNVAGGRCEACHGNGENKVEMHFLPDVYVPCPVCNGARYNRETLQVHYKGKNIAEILDMTIEEGLAFFNNHASIKRKLQTLIDVGLGYLKIGQPSPELSGGEAQRVKLAAELGKVSTGRTLYILDEPTTGLHVADIAKLVQVLTRLVDQGNSVLVIEHNLDVIKMADYIIDLGPEGGEGGGNIVAQGTPEELAKNPASFTGQFLGPILARDRI